MSKSLLSVVVVPAWAFLHAVPVPWQVRTVLPAVTTWPRSVVLKRGAKVRSAEADGASAAATARAATRTTVGRRSPGEPRTRARTTVGRRSSGAPRTRTRIPANRRAPRAEPPLQCCRERWTNLVSCGAEPAPRDAALGFLALPNA